MHRRTSNNCRAISRCREARNRQKVHCGGKRADLQDPYQHRLPFQEPQMVQPGKTHVQRQHHRQHKLKSRLDVVIRWIVTCSSTSCWNPSFSSIVATGNKPP